MSEKVFYKILEIILLSSPFYIQVFEEMFTNKFKKYFHLKNTLNYSIGIFISMLESSHGWNTQLIKAVKDNNTLKTRAL